jgi:signal transduction histidine kinase/ActR/RegA family two-component response regulator
MLQDWRFENSPYVEFGGLRAYAGAPLRLQNETGDTVCLGSICVASPTRQDPLTKAQQTTLARLADWIVADIVQLTRARRQRERRRMVDMLAAAQEETDTAVSEEPVMRMLQTAYPDAVVSLQTCKVGRVELMGQDHVLLADFSDHLWEDIDHIDEFITTSNHLEPPNDRIVRAIAVPCESVSGHSFLVVGSKDFRQIFDDIDAWFVEKSASIISQMWHKRLLAEVMVAKEKFLRGFSHQLRTPVHGILGSVELLAEDLKARSLSGSVSKTTALLQLTSVANPDEGHGVYLDTIKRAGRDLISIINSMITLNRWADVAITDRHYASHTALDLETELVSDLQKTVSGDTRYNATIFFNHTLPPDHCNLRTDLSLLRDSLLPIIINAIQSMTEGLVVITISTRPDSKELVVDITDTGHGIPLEDRQRIFELYEQVDVYSTGAGLGLTLATRFAALLKGSIELVSSEINRGSHFRATFQDVEVTYSESLQAEPMIPRLANIPRRFHVVPSIHKALSLSDHFAKSLSCYDFTASTDINDGLIILDFVADSEQHRAALARLPSDRVVICLVPFSEGEIHFDNTLSNVVYVRGPFETRTMISALKDADRMISLLEAKLADTPTLGENTSQEEIQCDGLSSVVQEAGGIVKDLSPEQDLLTREATGIGYIHRASNAPETPSPSPSQPHRIESNPFFSLPQLGKGQLPTPPLEEDLAGLNFNGSVTTETNDIHMSSGQLLNSNSTPILPNPATTSHPTALLVDDNAVNLRVLQMYCNKRHLSYICAKDGREAVSVFHAHQESAVAENKSLPIQLILMDLQMPVCDGIEATRRIRELEAEKNWGKSVVFMVTGQDSPADREAADDAGAQEYFVKPISMKALDGALKRYFPCFEAGK